MTEFFNILRTMFLVMKLIYRDSFSLLYMLARFKPKTDNLKQVNKVCLKSGILNSLDNDPQPPPPRGRAVNMIFKVFNEKASHSRQ